MEPTITPIDATLGATITDIDLAQLDEPTWNCVEDAFHEYAVLVFPAQNLTGDAQVAFSGRFGEIDAGDRGAERGLEGCDGWLHAILLLGGLNDDRASSDDIIVF